MNRWVTKVWSGFIGVGNMLRHYGWQEDARCPLCGAANKKVSHLLTRPNKNAAKLYASKLKNDLIPVLEENLTSPLLQEVIINALKKVRKRSSGAISAANYPPEIRQAVKDQKKIG